MDSVKSDRVRDRLRAAAETLARNQRLIRLRCDLAGLPALDALRLGAPDAGRLRELYRRWGFGSMGRALDAATGPLAGHAAAETAATSGAAVQAELF
jgi:DNA polymerase-1